MTTISLTPPIRPPQAADMSEQHVPPTPASADIPRRESPSYFSPVVRFDPLTAAAVWEILDPDTGQVVRQFPREATIKAYLAQSAEPVASVSHGRESGTASAATPK